MAVFKFNYKKEVKQNPFIGLVSFNHFNNDELYSDLIVRPENNMTETERVECYPVPAYVEENGRFQGYYPNCSVAYIRVLWKEFEPKRGEYDYAFIQSILNKAKENNQTVMFRLMPHSTRETDDVPEWFKQIVECPKRPQGQRVKDSPKDPKFLELFGNAIKKFGERFDGNTTLSMVDISLPGAWGEGDSIDLFTNEQIKSFVDIYVDCFKQTTLIGQIVPWVVNYVNEKSKVGYRADCIGKPNLTFERVPLLVEQMPDVWKRGHISFEAYWWLGEWKRQGWDIDKIIDLTLSLHISTFNAKSLPIPYEWKDKIDKWISKMGYHFVIDSVEIPDNIFDNLDVTLTIDNVGVAPIYNRLPLNVILKNDKYERVFKTNVDITKWIVGKNVEKIKIDLPNDLSKGEYLLEICVGGGELPTVAFATDAHLDNQAYILAKIKIK